MYSPPSLLGDDKEATLLLIAKANRNSSVFTQGCFHKDFSLLSFDIVFSSKIEMVRHQTFEPQKKVWKLEPSSLPYFFFQGG